MVAQVTPPVHIHLADMNTNQEFNQGIRMVYTVRIRVRVAIAIHHTVGPRINFLLGFQNG